MVDIGDGVSRELCGGTHVPITDAIGLFDLTHETSSASNVRRIEAVTGPVGDRDVPAPHGGAARARPDAARARAGDRQRRAPSCRSRSRRRPSARRSTTAQLADSVIGARRGDRRHPRRDPGRRRARRQGAARAVRPREAVARRRRRRARHRRRRAACTSSRTSPTPRSAAALKAGDVVKVAAQVAGGGGGGRPTMAQAGGRDPEKLPEAIAAARAAIENALR